MAVVFHVMKGEPPESIVEQEQILIDDVILNYGGLKYEFYGQYFPVIEDDNHSGKNAIVLKILENDKKVSPYDEIGFYLLKE